MDLTSARAKLVNAGTHLDRLRCDTETELESHAASLGATYDEGTDRHTVHLESAPDMTDVALRLSVIVGDVVHNLRSALDHLAWSAACAHSPTGTPARPREIQFRLCTITTCTTRGEAHFGAAIWDSLHEWQPCKGTNNRPDGWSGAYIHQADLLARLNNDDKHKNLTQLLFQASRATYAATDISGNAWRPRGVGDFVPKGNYEYEVGAPMFELRAPAWPKSNLSGVGSAASTLALAGDNGRHAISTLERLEMYVSDVLAAMAEL